MTILSKLGSATAKTGNFLGINKFGQGIAGAARVLTGEVGQDIERMNANSAQVGKLIYAAKQEKDPTKRARLLQLAKGLGTGTSATEIDPNLNLSNREILGSAANVGLNILTPGAFKGGAGAVIGKNAALGAGFGLASGMEKGRSAKGLVGSTVGGALVGGALGTGAVAFRGLKNVFTKKLPPVLMDKAVKPAINELRKNVKYGSETLGKELLDEGVKGGPKRLLEIADQKLGSLEDELQTVLSSPSASGIRIKKQDLAKYLSDSIQSKRLTPGMAGDAKIMEGVLKTIPNEMTLVEANQMKRRLYTELRDPAFKLDAKLSAKSQAMKGIARGLKSEIENSVGGTIISDINKKLSIYGRLESSVVDQMARQLKNNAFSLTDGLLLTAGAAGSAFSPDQQTRPLGLFLAILGILGRHNAPAINTYAATGLNKLGQMGSSKIGQTISGAARRGVLNIP